MNNKLLVKTHIVGWQYRSETAQNILRNDTLPVGAKLQLVNEPDNPKDSHAVQIFFGDMLLGYLPREIAYVYDTVWKNKYPSIGCTYAGKRWVKLIAINKKEEKVKKKTIDMTKRQTVRIVPVIAEIKGNTLYLDKIPYQAKIYDVGAYLVAETMHNIVILHKSDKRRFKVLDKEYKVMPEAVFVVTVQDDEIVYEKMDIVEWIINALVTMPDQYSVNIVAKAWGELRSRELNTFPGMAFKTDDNGNIITRFKERQIAARFQLFRPTAMPYVVVVLGGLDLHEVMKMATSVSPIKRNTYLTDAMLKIATEEHITFVPSGIGTALGDVFSKLNVLPKDNPVYEEDPKFMLRVKVYNSQKDLGLGAGAMRVRRDLQNYLSRSSLNRTVTVVVDKVLFKKYIFARDKIKNMGPIQSFKITNANGERVSIPRAAQHIGAAVDKFFKVYDIDMVYNGRERNYYIKFYVSFSYHAIRTGDKLLSFEREFLKGVAVVSDDMPKNIHIECTWDNIKGTDYRLVRHYKNHSVIKINPASLFVVERGTSNLRRPNNFEMRGHDAFEMLTINELFPDLADEIKNSSDPRLRLFPEAYNVLIRNKVIVDKELDALLVLTHIGKFLSGEENMFENNFDGGYVTIGKKKMPLPSTNLIVGLSNEYDSGIAFRPSILRYMKTLEYFLSVGQVIDKRRSKGKYEPNIEDYRKYAETELYNMFKSPRLTASSSIKRIVNHMEDYQPTTVAVRDHDSIFTVNGKEVDVVYGVASVYPSVHKLQVKHKFVRIVKFSLFKLAFEKETGKELKIDSIDDAVLMSPHLVNSVFIKDNDGDALAIRVIGNQKLARKLWATTSRDFFKDIEKIKIIANKTEIWEVQKPKELLPEITVTPTSSVHLLHTGISGKLMIGMITRLGRKVQYALSKLAKAKPEYSLLCEQTELAIAKAMQDVIDGLKHERDVKDAAKLYLFMYNLVNLDWDGKDARKNRARIYGSLEQCSLNNNLKVVLEDLSRIIKSSYYALSWLFGDKKEDGVSLARYFVDFGREFPRIAKCYLPDHQELK